ncbi:hypothetical protein K523DRAFT_335403 [Schizophyllum commune Tattone D]|nr:hypothetical protein K523DRAFT_335403 [Schizophyllum commune Tattone D]
MIMLPLHLPLPLVPVSSSLPPIASSSSLPPVAASSPLLPAPPPPRYPSRFPTWCTAMHGLWNGNKDLSAMWKKLGERGIWWTAIPYMHTYSPVVNAGLEDIYSPVQQDYG